jgi:hypothetical protein
MKKDRDRTMGFFGKKKAKKVEEVPVEKKEEPKPSEGPTLEFDAEGRPIKPEYMRASKVELGTVESAIDLKSRAESRQNILKMYEDRFGEKLDAPEFSAGLNYEYQLYEEGTYSTKRDLKDIEKAAKAGTEGVVPAEGATKVESAPATTDAGTKTEGIVEAAATKTEAVKTDGAKTEGTDKPKDVAKVEAPSKPVGPGFFDPEKPIDWQKSALWCIGLGKPFWPIMRYVRYKARKQEGWMKLLLIVDFFTIVEPLSWIWRFPARVGYEIYKMKKKSDAKKAEEAAKAKEARRAAKEKERAEKIAKANKAYRA